MGFGLFGATDSRSGRQEKKKREGHFLSSLFLPRSYATLSPPPPKTRGPVTLRLFPLPPRLRLLAHAAFALDIFGARRRSGTARGRFHRTDSGRCGDLSRSPASSPRQKQRRRRGKAALNISSCEPACVRARHRWGCVLRVCAPQTCRCCAAGEKVERVQTSANM
ncbi:hypothetical protein KUCAC02_032997 [Chaenocephalus aceratus]|nr:hypothetical protein KUCAC02_032997 [Chaenocephalus aceratus]